LHWISETDANRIAEIRLYDYLFLDELSREEPEEDSAAEENNEAGIIS
jgi:hypothetical protein